MTIGGACIHEAPFPVLVGICGGPMSVWLVGSYRYTHDGMTTSSLRTSSRCPRTWALWPCCYEGVYLGIAVVAVLDDLRS